MEGGPAPDPADLAPASAGAPDRTVDDLADHLVHELTSTGSPGRDDIALLVARIG